MMESVDPETGEFYGEIRPEQRVCGHCCEVMRGYASLGDTWLCHPDDGLDCYSAVTLHKHPMRCTICDPSLEYATTWAEVRAEFTKDWTPQDWARFDAEVADPGCTRRRLSRIRRLWRRKGKGRR